VRSLLQLFDNIEQTISGKKGGGLGMVRFYSEFDMPLWGGFGLDLEALLKQYIDSGTGIRYLASIIISNYK
jgi:hypothetical protein